MGPQGFAGSVLCMTETGPGTGAYLPAEYFRQQIAQTNAANTLTQALLTVSGASTRS